MAANVSTEGWKRTKEQHKHLLLNLFLLTANGTLEGKREATTFLLYAVTLCTHKHGTCAASFIALADVWRRFHSLAARTVELVAQSEQCADSEGLESAASAEARLGRAPFFSVVHATVCLSRSGN